MRAILILYILILVLGLGYGFRVNDVLDALGGVVQETQRQSDVNDNIPAVFAATLGASLIANAVLNKPPDTLNKIGRYHRINGVTTYTIKTCNFRLSLWS